MIEDDRLTIGIDLGGTKTEIGLVDTLGRIRESQRFPTSHGRGAAAIVADIVQTTKELIKKLEAEPGAIGVGVAGQIDSEKGVVINAPNLGWIEVPLKSELEKGLEIPSFIFNDVRAATFGEWKFGAGRACGDIVCVFVGTGIGGGIVSGGNLLTGCSNTAGELGHVTIAVDGRECHCNNRGCLEAYAGGWAIAQRAKEVVSKDPVSGAMIIRIAGSLEGISAGHVAEAFLQGDGLALRLVEETGHFLGAGLVGIINGFNPCMLILGGGIIEGLPSLIEIVETEIMKKSLPASTSKLQIRKAELAGDAGVIGAAAMTQILKSN